MKFKPDQKTLPFKVVTVSTKANSFGLHGHVLMNEQGEAWQVGRNRGPQNSDVPFNTGDVVQVPVDENDNDRPQWHLLSCEIPSQLAKAPPEVIKEVWG